MAVGLPLKTTYADGDVYKASDVNDTNGTINAYLAPSLGTAAGKNKIINGDFGVWQRGTSFTATNAYTTDRWYMEGDRTSPSITRQTFTAGAAPVAGYEGTYFARWAPGTAGTYCNLQQKIENVRTFAGQTVTLSYWAKCSTGTLTNEPYLIQYFGTGGSTGVDIAAGSDTITTTWTRFTHTVSVPSISGKTVGTNSYLQALPFRLTSGTSTTIDLWGVQLEAGSTATAFQTATGTIQGELDLCKRYCRKSYKADVSPATATQEGAIVYKCAFTDSYQQMYSTFDVEMRTTPTVTFYSTNNGATGVAYNGSTNIPVTAAGQIGTSSFAPYINNSSQGAGVVIKVQYLAEAEL